MRHIKSGLTVLLFVLATLLSVGSSDAQAQTRKFSFEVCNHSKVSASVAVSSHVAVGDSRFETQGWWTVNAGDCDTLGDFPNGWFYVYAEQTNSGKIVWEGDTPLCVEFPGPFDRVHTDGYTCDSDSLKHFDSELIPDSTGTYTFNLR
jgi:uncharacterized membrane protein